MTSYIFRIFKKEKRSQQQQNAELYLQLIHCTEMICQKMKELGLTEYLLIQAIHHRASFEFSVKLS